MNLPNTAVRFILFFIRRQWVGFLIAFLACVLWAINDVFFPFFLKLIVNSLADFTKQPNVSVYSVVKIPAILLMLFWFATEFILRIQGIILLNIIPRFRANIREAVFNYVKRHSHEFFSSHFAGNIAKKLSELPSSCQNVLEIFFYNFTTALVAFITAFILMWLSHPTFAGLLLLWFVLHMGITIAFLRIGNVRWEDHSESVSVLSGNIVDSFTNMLNVRLFARGQYESQYIANYQAEEIKKAKKALWLVEILRMLQGMFAFLLMCFMLFVLIYGWSHGWVTLGDFTQIGMQTFWVLGMVWFMSNQMTTFIREIGTINNALRLVTKRHDIVDLPNADRLIVSHGEICFDHVNFRYQKRSTVFTELTVTIKAGEKVGLVGFSGSGKSTFVNLILRFYDLDSGRILIDYQDIAKKQQDSLRAQIAMIPQEPSLFHRSLMENIRYGRLDATDNEVIAAAKLAHCHEFIQVLDQGYQTLVGERGVKLSGGQRQRIAIARAILKNAPILILDEATSSLDSVTEKLIQDSLQHLMQGRTTIVVAHRLSTLADMDRILVFHQGKIVEDGTQETLLKANGHFAMLWNMQTDGFLPEDEE